MKSSRPFPSDIQFRELQAKSASFSSRVQWAYHIAQEAVKYPELVDPELYRQAIGYTKLGAWIGLPEDITAGLLQQRGYRFAGWSREAILSGAFGEKNVPTRFLPSLPIEVETVGEVPTIKRTAEIGGLTSGPQFVSQWNKQALTERLRKSIEYGPYEETMPWKEFYKGIATRARRFGVEKELLTPGMRPYGLEMLKEALFPPTGTQMVGRAGKSLWGAAKSRPFIVGGAVALLGLYATKPLSLFSGKDDSYNTIEGLPHGGTAERMRRIHTDFGSGYKGLVKLPEILQPLLMNIAGYTAPVSESISLLKAAAGVHLESYLPSIKLFEKELLKSPYKQTSWINPLAIRQSAESTGGRISYSEMLRGTIKHERFHQKVVETGIREKLQKASRFVPEKFRTMYPMLGAGRPEVLVEEYFAYAETFRRAKNPAAITKEIFGSTWSRFSGFDDVYNTIEGFSHKGISGRIRRFFGFGSGWRGLLNKRNLLIGGGITGAGLGALAIGSLFSSEQSEAEKQAYLRRTKYQFAGYAAALSRYGSFAGTGHKRILIPKTQLTEEELGDLGFTSTLFAIPESGQDELASYRNPFNLYHIHSHGDVWSMHKDRYAAITMAIKKDFADNEGFGINLLQAFSEAPAGMMHMVTEGVPGLYYFLKNRLGENIPMRRRLEEERVARISGKGDIYNTIEGLPHQGMAGASRKQNTDFGSGWRGLLALPDILGSLVSKRSMSMTPARLATFLGEKVSTSAQKEALQKFLGEARKSAFEEVSVVNPIAIRKAANQAGISYSKALKGTIRHERFHQAVRQVELRGELGFEAPVGFLPSRAREEAAEEFIAISLESRFTGLSHPNAPAAVDYFKQQLEPAIHRGLEGFKHKGITGVMRQDYGFGSGGILAKIMGFANKLFKSNIEKHILSPAEAKKIFNTELSIERTLASETRNPLLQRKMAKPLTLEERIQNLPEVFPEEVSQISNSISTNAIVKKKQLEQLHKQAMTQSASFSLRPGRRHTNFSASSKSKV